MISKIKLKELAAYRLQKRCDEEAVFVVEGPKMAAEAIASGASIRTVCATREWVAVNGEWRMASGEFYEVSQTELDRLSGLKNPGNMGTLMRTADWFGVRHIVCSHDTVGCFNPKVVQATMGAIFRTWVEYVDLPQWLASCGMPVYGASLHGEPLKADNKLHRQGVLLIGNESRGISPEAMAAVTHPVLIPNLGGTAESLNASVAAGILIYELMR